jgi:hypothetical protein
MTHNYTGTWNMFCFTITYVSLCVHLLHSVYKCVWKASFSYFGSHRPDDGGNGHF